MEPEQNKLNLGCGWKKLNDHWNVDIHEKCNPDQLLDLESLPWPYADNFFERITAENILEHLGQQPRLFIDIIKEMYRVSKPGAEWFVRVPHHRCDLFWDDPTHVRSISAKTLRMFDQNFNRLIIENGRSESTFGLMHDIDIEVISEDYRLLDIWLKQIENGELTMKQANINLNTLANVVECVDIFVKVHKPVRQPGYLNT